MPETFIIEAYSDFGRALWTDDWQCHACGQVMNSDTVDFATHCPLHNPMYCTGRTSGDRHTSQPCEPRVGAKVFLLHFGQEDLAERRTVIGRIPARNRS